MSQAYRGPPPPGPKYVPVKSPSTESDENDCIYRYNTELLPSKNVLVEGRLEESTGRALVYLDTEAILKTRLSHHIGRSEATFYDAEEIYILVVDGLNSVQDAKGNEAGNFSPPSVELLQKCKEASTASLEMAMLHCDKMEYNTPALFWKKKESWALDKARVQATLLHGQECTIWKGKDPVTRKRLGCGRLSFGGFMSFSVRERGNVPQFFKCGNKDILSGKISIEKATADAKSSWEVFV